MSKTNPCLYNEQFRPQFHFTTKNQRWINDPNGMVYFKGEWHLFYQYNPTSKHNGSMHWGHAVTRDLLHFEELDIALKPDRLGHIWSGSCVVDENNVSGLFDGIAGGGIIAFYTNTDPNNEWVQRQSMAYSTDNGRTFTKYEKNPIILENRSTKNGTIDPVCDNDFRDPKVIWCEDANRWIMVVAGGALRIYSSKNLKDWEIESHYDKDQEIDGTYISKIYTECPDLFPLVCKETNETKWIMLEAGRNYRIGQLKQCSNGSIYYFTEHFERLTSSLDAYAGQTFSNAANNRRILIQWMMNPGKAYEQTQIINSVNGFRCSQTMFIELSLVWTEEGYRIYQNPIHEYKCLRSKPVVEFNCIKTGALINPLSSLSCECYELEATIKPTSPYGEIGMKLRMGEGEETIVKYDIKNSLLITDKTKSGICNHKGYLENGINCNKISKKSDGTITLNIFVDRQSLEVFANEGECYLSELIFPSESSLGAEFFSTASAEISLTVYPLKSIW